MSALDQDQGSKHGLSPQSLHNMAIVRWIIVVLSVIVAVGSWWSWLHAAGRDGSATAAPKYQCPMHPSIVSNEPGSCPICGMALEPIAHERSHAPTASAPDGGAPAGVVPITLTLDRLQSIGVRMATVTAHDVAPTLRVTASVAAPEQGTSEVHVRTPGFVERIQVRETGVKVAAGQELFAMYSPEVYQAEAELVAARAMASDDASAALSPFAGGAGALTESRITSAARSKLLLLGVSGHAIDEVIRSGKPVRAVSVTAPASGWITRKNVVLGSYVTPEATLYEIVDLSRIYVVADVPAGDLAEVAIGSRGTFIVSGRSDLETTAVVDLIYPRTNPEARTARVRMQSANDTTRFLPGQYGTVTFERQKRSATFVPRDAVIETGEHTYVFVDKGGGTLEPRTVVTGRAHDAEVEIARGVEVGERVVAGATFLVDSESRLRAAIAESQNGH